MGNFNPHVTRTSAFQSTGLVSIDSNILNFCAVEKLTTRSQTHFTKENFIRTGTTFNQQHLVLFVVLNHLNPFLAHGETAVQWRRAIFLKIVVARESSRIKSFTP